MTFYETPEFSQEELEFEVWVPIDGSASRFQVSNLGRARSLGSGDAMPKMFSLRSKKSGDSTYREISATTVDGRNQNLRVNNIVASNFCLPGKGDLVRHLDGNTFNNRLTNLTRCVRVSPFRFPELDSNKVPLVKRRCNKCGKHKGLPCFYRDASKAWGTVSNCIPCVKVSGAISRDTPKRRAAANEKAKLQYKENRAQRIEYARQWKLKNPDRALVLARRRNSERAATDPLFLEKRRQAVNTRRARRAAQFVEEIDRGFVWKISAGRCCLCGLNMSSTNWHLEHLTPLARGGLHAYANVGAAHPRCNIRKGTKTFDEWLYSWHFTRED